MIKQELGKRPEITADLSVRIEKKINPNNDTRIYWAKEVTLDYGTGHAVRVDYMKFEPANNTVSGIEKGDSFCYEVKSSIEDFHSGHGLNFVGDYNYLVMPEEVYKIAKKEIPYYVGVYVPDGITELKCIHRAKRYNRTKPVSELLLMMFRSAARDRQKGNTRISDEN